MDITQMLTIAVAGLFFLIIILGFIYWYMSWKSKKEQKNNQGNNTDGAGAGSHARAGKTSPASQYTKLSVFDFMEFDTVEDNMIIQKNGSRYLMVIDCEGINYDLMSDVEKTSVEQGFIQFLNTLTHPIQLYTQTRTINIGHSIEGYSRRVKDIKTERDQKQIELNKMVQSGAYSPKDVEEIKREIARLQNLYDYGVDIVSNIEKMSLNKNVLRKYYYIVVPYYASELGPYEADEEDKKNMIFSELYTRAQAITRTLFACSMKCRIMDSNEVVELLYNAYNRDEAEVYSVERALASGYAELYSTAPDVLDKKIAAINNEIEERAFELATETVDAVKSEKEKSIERKQETFEDIIKEMAEKMIIDNKQYIGEDVAKESISRIKKTKEKGVSVNEQKEKAGKVSKAS